MELDLRVVPVEPVHHHGDGLAADVEQPAAADGEEEQPAEEARAPESVVAAEDLPDHVHEPGRDDDQHEQELEHVVGDGVPEGHEPVARLVLAPVVDEQHLGDKLDHGDGGQAVADADVGGGELAEARDLVGVDGVHDDALLPAHALLPEVGEVEGRLLLHDGADEAEALAGGGGAQRLREVLGDGVLVADVEADLVLDLGVDHEEGAVHAEDGEVGELADEALLAEVVADADGVRDVEDPVLGLRLGVDDESVGEDGAHAAVLDVLVLLEAPVGDLVPVLHVEVGLLVHVQDPGVVVAVDGARGVVQRAALELGVVGRLLGVGDHALVHDGDGVQVHLLVRDDLQLPERARRQRGVRDDLLHVVGALDDGRWVGAARHEAHVDLGHDLGVLGLGADLGRELAAQPLQLAHLRQHDHRQN